MDWKELENHVKKYKMRQVAKTQLIKKHTAYSPIWLRMRRYSPSFAGWFQLRQNKKTLEEGALMALQTLKINGVIRL